MRRFPTTARLGVTLVLTALAHTILSAQAPLINRPVPAPGDRLRVRVPELPERLVEGLFQETDGTDLVLLTSAGSQRLPLAALYRVERLPGNRGSHWTPLSPWVLRPVVLPGTRVRLRAGQAPDVEGRVVSLGADELTLANTTGETISLPISAIRVVSVPNGDRSVTREGVLIGGLAGALVGGLIGLVAEPECRADAFCFRGVATGAGALGGATVGGLLGLLATVGKRVTAWEPALSPARALQVR